MPVPMEEVEIDSETDQDPSVLEVPAINWARYVGVKSVQYEKKGHSPRIAAEEQNDWNLSRRNAKIAFPARSPVRGLNLTYLEQKK